MPYPFFSYDTLDDVLFYVTQEILSDGSPVVATRGPMREFTGVMIQIENPRARLSRTETRGKPYSCLGELFWYLAGTDSLDFITYYIAKYKKYADGDKIYGGYGPRLFNWNGLDQFRRLKEILSQKASSRKAVIQLFHANDIQVDRKEVPCTCTLQFLIRKDRLDLIVYMRSNDLYLGMPHDIFSFTMLQEILARDLGTEIGSYKHVVGSLHLYDIDKRNAKQFLDEGFQSTLFPMPAMPMGNPWPSIETVLRSESLIRMEEQANELIPDGLDPYWADLIRLLQVYRYKKDGNQEGIRLLRTQFSTGVYDPFVSKLLLR